MLWCSYTDELENKMNTNSRKDRVIAQREKLKEMSLDQLFDMIEQVERQLKLAQNTAGVTGDRTLVRSVTLVATWLYSEVEDRHPEVAEAMDEWADSDDMALPSSYGDALAMALGR